MHAAGRKIPADYASSAGAERSSGPKWRRRERGGESGERMRGRESGRGVGAITGESKGEKGTTERQEWPRTMRNTVIAK